MLDDSSIDWAIEFISRHSDGDLFPRILEIEAISENKNDFITEIQKESPTPVIGACRRFIVQKDELSYRQATQLYPQDSIILTALIYQYGHGIEKRRQNKRFVYSYRFNPDMDVGLYSSERNYEKFWNNALKKANKGCVLYCDIADFYNQIYHHSLENQLAESDFPNQAIKWIIKLLNSTTANVSRGIPVGPHATHILAEAAMIPIDNSLIDKGIKFMRYADDILVFCKNPHHAKVTLAEIASTLDKQQRLMLQRHKTRIMNPVEFKNVYDGILENRTQFEDVDEIYEIIDKYSDGDPYATIGYLEMDDEDRESITEEIIERIIDEYLEEQSIDYSSLKWFYRRLSQIGHPGAMNV